MAANSTAFTVEMGEEMYSIVAPDGTTGEPVEYEEAATLMWNGILYYAHVDNPNDFPEGGDAPPVLRVDATTVMESTMEEVSDESQGEQEEEDEEDEEEDEEEEGEQPGDVVEFPPPPDEDDEENLPRAD